MNIILAHCLIFVKTFHVQWEEGHDRT